MSEKGKIDLVVGQKVNVDIYKGKKGAFPIGKYGAIFCKLFIPKSVGHIEYGCTCLVKVTKISERSIESTVLEVVRSAAANNFEMSKKLNSLEAPQEVVVHGRKKNMAIADSIYKAVTKKGKEINHGK